MMLDARPGARAAARITHTVTESPLGPLTLVAHDGVLAGVHFDARTRWPARPAPGTRDDAAFGDAIRQLDEYFRGERTRFELHLAPRGNAFEQSVWALLQRIPRGETRSYGQLAAELGDAALARDVGVANARNPIAVIVPCHRVLGADGRLVGYAGGLERKRFLLDLEQLGVVMAYSLNSLPLPASRSAPIR
jgi:methylated-DNA-[protein]-cysteine S-methyltransferase